MMWRVLVLLIVVLVLKAVIVAGISLGLFTPLNPLYAPLQVLSTNLWKCLVFDDRCC